MHRLLPTLFLLLVQLQARAHSATWTDGIACMIYSHCTSCHNPNGIAPFSLTTYNDVYANRFSIAASVQAKSMPPFPASQTRAQYAHANTLSDHEINEIRDWVTNFAPLGNASAVPTPPVYQPGPQITAPSQVLQIPNYTVNTSSDLYRVFVIPVNNAQQQKIQRIEVVPGNKAIVHHVLVYQDTSSTPLQLDAADPGPGYTAFGGTGSTTSQLLGGWVPGQDAYTFPPGFGGQLPANTRLCVQVHYPGGISNQIDSTQIRLVYGSATLRNLDMVPAINHYNTLTNGPLYIPANTVKTFNARVTVPYNVTMAGLLPHMHLLGQRIESYAVKPNGDTIFLVNIPQWDFHWQRNYQFQKPILVPAGSVVYATAVYDNTTGNPSNPSNPPINVSAGEGTKDEMMLIYFSIALYQPGDTSILIDTASHFPHYMNCHGNSLSVGNVTSGNPITLSPNPAHTLFHISGIDGPFEARIYTGEGRIVREVSLQTAAEPLDVASLPAATYYLQIRLKNGLVSYQKLVKQ
ncbi:MAG: T9SS type A sorting domain-containing protein [Sphingobacteriales bacterium]|nr:MAG: T9SS type A sorting domain-containing protein [Sphingobacteriales bacterium]